MGLLTACSATRSSPCPSALPPAAYLQDVALPKLGGKTNRDLLEWGIKNREAAQQGNADKARIREWVAEQAKPP